MKNTVAFITFICVAFYAGIWFEKQTSAAASAEQGLEQKDNIKTVDFYVAQADPLSKKHAEVINEAPVTGKCATSNKNANDAFAINNNTVQDINRYLARNKLAPKEIIDMYMQAVKPEIQELLQNFLSNTLAHDSIALASTFIADDNPKARQLAYTLLGAYDTDGNEVPNQLIDASYFETNPSATVKLVKAMANTCAHATKAISQRCVNRMLNIIEYSGPNVVSDSLQALSKMPLTKGSISVFSDKLYSEIPEQRFIALNALYNAQKLEQHTLNSIQNIADDEKSSIIMRELASDLLRHYKRDLG